ncbi:MAG: aminotransferase class IV [Candidatus Bathyarchaeia archaeon]
MSECVSYLNGEWVPNSQMKINVADRGVAKADAIYDVARTYNGKVFKLERHVERLRRSMKYTRMNSKLSAGEIGQIMEEGAQRNEGLRKQYGDFYLWPFVTRGVGLWAYTAGPCTIGVQVIPLPFDRFAKYFHTGAHGVIVKTRSYAPGTVDPRVKHYSRMNFAMAELEANDVEPGGWPILTDVYGNLTEGTINSIFMVSRGVIRTPCDRSILPSISRSVVFDLAKQLGIRVVEEDLQPYDLYAADEAFITFTGPGVLPMTHVDKRIIGDGKPGSVTKRLLTAWSKLAGLDVVDQAMRYARL